MQVSAEAVGLERTESARQTVQVALAGHFSPATIAPLLPPAAAAMLTSVVGPPAVPLENLAYGFAKRGIPIAIIGGLVSGPDLDISGGPVNVVLYRKRGTRAFSLDGLRRERRLILNRLHCIQPAIVHAHWTMEAARAVAQWSGPKVLTIHDAMYKYARLEWAWRPGAVAYRLRWITNTLAILKAFTHIIAVSPFVESYLRLHHAFQGEIRVIPNCVPPLPAAISVCNTFPKSGHVTFGCYGGPGKLKNIDAAIEAFRRVKPKLPGSRLVIYGGGWKGLEATKDVGGIELRGSLPHEEFLNSLATEVDIWVHPSRLECHPIAICEAIQAGCPVIAGRASGGVPWTLDHGRAGLLVDVERPSDIAESMLGLVQNRQLALELLAHGRRTIAERFGPDKVFDQHLQYYDDIIAEHHAGGSPRR